MNIYFFTFIQKRMQCIVLFVLSTCSCLTVLAGQSESRTLKVLQFNIWQEGTMVPDGFRSIVAEIVRSEPDFVALSEVRNYQNTRFCDRIVEALKAKGKSYYSFYSYDSGLLSKYPILDSVTVLAPKDDKGSAYKMIVEIDKQEFAVYTAHLNYREYASNEPRGYDGNSFKKKAEGQESDLKKVLDMNRRSGRIDVIRDIIKDAQKELAKGRMVFFGGDFNEPSFLDWTKATKHLFDHNGLVVPWDCTIALQRAGFVDAYRHIYRNPVTHPGFTFPANTPKADLSRLVWSPQADDRDRIDYIFYYPDKHLVLKDVQIIGPLGDIVRGQRIEEKTKDNIFTPGYVWPTDHKAVLATFEWK